jgi:GH25 family lysozyme M1 (1,4-beta-N-acetylmuramidase)
LTRNRHGGEREIERSWNSRETAGQEGGIIMSAPPAGRRQRLRDGAGGEGQLAWVTGLDVSRWQLPSPGFAATRQRSGDAFIWMKASQGGRSRDRHMAEHHGHFGAKGFARGPYHFYDFASSATANARNFLAATAGRNWELPHVLDAEHGGLASAAETAAELLLFLRIVEEGTGRRPVAYTYASWWNARVRPDPEFCRHPLWIARYRNRHIDGTAPRSDETTPAAAPWDHWDIWQYSTTGGTLDRNICSAETFAALTGGPARSTTEEGPFMALTHDEQVELLQKTRRNNEILEKLEADYLIRGKGVRQALAVIDHRTEDLVTGRRPQH